MLQTAQECTALSFRPLLSGIPLLPHLLHLLGTNHSRHHSAWDPPNHAQAFHNFQVSRSATHLVSAAACRARGILCYTLVTHHQCSQCNIKSVLHATNSVLYISLLQGPRSSPSRACMHTFTSTYACERVCNGKRAVGEGAHV
jgi:hypothetical protein